MARVEFEPTEMPRDEPLRYAARGLIQISDFRRGRVRDDPGIRSLPASILFPYRSER
jgi:hypothetical protein